MSGRRLIGFIPQDDRPVSLSQPRRLLEDYGWRVLSPPEAFLGHRTKAGQAEKLSAWLLRNAHHADGWVISLDMLVYGGLVPSRELHSDLPSCQKQLATLERLRQKIPDVPIFAFQSIRRLSTTVATSEDLQKWEEHLDGKGLAPERERNHHINLAAVELLGKSCLDWLSLLQEDAQDNETINLEHNRLLERASLLSCEDKLCVTTGCDEGAQVLLTRMACRLSDFTPHVVVNFSSESGSKRKALYEERSIRDTAFGQLKCLGAKTVTDPDGAEVELWVWCPDRECRDLWLNGPYEKGDDGLDRFIEYIANTIETCGHAVTVADVAYANGACPHFCKRLVKNVNIGHLSGFAAWNTAANTVGSALAQGTLAALALEQIPADSDVSLLHRLGNGVLFHRFVEDWAYQTELRPLLKSFVEDDLQSDPWFLAAAAKRQAERFISEAVDSWCDEHLEYGFSSRYGFWGIDITLPWSRLFEIEIGEETRDEVVITPINDGGDVIVCGGGLSGVCAAISAARNGARTTLIEKSSVLGGSAIQSLVQPWMGFFASPEKQVVAGIAQELVDIVIARGGSPGHVPDTIGCASMLTPLSTLELRFAVDRLLYEAGVKVLTDTLVTGVLFPGSTGVRLPVDYFSRERPMSVRGPLAGVIIENKSGRRALASSVVIDATGDGDVAALAGVAFAHGRKQDGLTQPMSLLFRMANVAIDTIKDYISQNPNEFVLSDEARLSLAQVQNLAVAGFFSQVKEAQEAGDLGDFRDRVLFFEVGHEGEVIVNMTRVVGLSGIDGAERSLASHLALEQVDECVSFLKKYVPGFEKSYLNEVAPYIGVRETRHISGRYTLTEEDVLLGREFEDSIARGAFPIDIHSPDGGSLDIKSMEPGTSYGIPFRCLVPLSIEGLLVTGRAISATHEASASARIGATAMALGQAAGTAASLAIIDRVAVSEVDIKELRRLLELHGAII